MLHQVGRSTSETFELSPSSKLLEKIGHGSKLVTSIFSLVVMLRR